MGLLDRLKGVFSKETCIGAINYDKRNLEIKVDAEADGTKSSLAQFKTEVLFLVAREIMPTIEGIETYYLSFCLYRKNLNGFGKKT